MLSLEWEYEANAFDIGDHCVERHGFGQSNYRAITTSSREGNARPHHARTRSRVGQWLFDHHQVDNQQSWGFGRALRRSAIWYGPKKSERDSKISHQTEPGPLLYGLPRTLEHIQAEDYVLLQGDLG